MEQLFYFCRCMALLLLQPATFSPLLAQPLQNGALHGAYTDASVGLPGRYASTLNPASSGHTPAGVLSVHTTRAYGISALNFAAAQVIFPIESHALILHARQLTFSAYTETMLEAGIATAFSPGTSRKLGVALLGTWKQTGIQHYGSDHLYAMTVGMQLPITPNLYLGAVGRHVVQTTFSQSESTLNLPKSLAIGIAYQPVAGVWLMGAHIQEQFFNPSIRIGMNLSPVQSIHLRFGFSNNPVKYALGVGLQLARLIIDLAAERHVVLGWTPGLSINLVFMRPKDE